MIKFYRSLSNAGRAFAGFGLILAGIVVAAGLIAR